MIVAGEASGDLHGGNLVQEMRRIDPRLTFVGVGGERMKAAGVNLVADVADMAVVGLTEVVFKLTKILKVMRRLKDILRNDPPELVILIDYPDFNFPIARSAHQRRIPVLYYISPQLWAWRKRRISTIRRFVDRMAVILPFEESFYRQCGVEVTFVGHPLLDEVKTHDEGQREVLKRLGFKEETTTIALLPGSRPTEVTRLLPEMLGACRILMGELSPLQFVLPLAGTLNASVVHNILRQFPVPVKIVQEGRYEAIALADTAIVASGTATLETALLGTPMVVVYRLSGLSHAVGRRCIKVKYISLVNLIAGQAIVPELIQEEANSQRIAAEVRDLIVGQEKARDMKVSLAKLREKLGDPGASQRTARIACEMMHRA